MKYLQIPVKQYKHRCFSVWFMYHWLLHHYISLELSSCFWHSPAFLTSLVALRTAACSSAGLAVPPEHSELWLALEVPPLHFEGHFHVTGNNCLLIVGLNHHKGLFQLKLLYYSMAIFIFFIRQKLDKHADTSKSKDQNIGSLHFWNIKIFERFGFLGALFCPDRTWDSRATL